MFVVQDLTIRTGSRAAQARFQNLLHGNWLAETSQFACGGGAEGLVAREEGEWVVDQAEWWAEFKIFQDRDGRYYWHLEAASGRIIAQAGHPYESKYWCEQDVNWLRANADLIRVYDHTRPVRRLAV